MIVDFTKQYKDNDCRIKELILQLISLFGNMKYVELMDFFPTANEHDISLNLFELVASKQLRIKSFSNKKSYYTTPALDKKGIGMKIRDKHKEICTFVRFLINSKDDDGYLINEIDCIGTDIFPFTIFIVCNNMFYHISHCTKNDIVLYEKTLSTCDKVMDKKETDHAKRQPSDAPYIITEDKDRIIVVDNTEYMDMIHFRHIKYIVCRKGLDYLIREGS